jgi:two-component system, OmpR family, phosphate regulon sensor histidine kinase PhoR
MGLTMGGEGRPGGGRLEVLRQRLAQERVARIEAERRATEQLAILTQLTEGVVIADPSGRITLVNDAARRFDGIEVGMSLEEYVATRRLLRLDGQPCPPDETPLVRALRGERVVGAEFRRVHPDGSSIVVRQSATAVTAEGGSLLAAVVTIEDVTAAHEMERQKDEFVANASHDLRTPLAAIKAAIRIVLAHEPPATPPELHRLFLNIDRSADRLAGLVDDLLGLAEVQAGQAQLRRGRHDLRELVQRAVDEIEPLLQAQGQRLAMDLPAEPIPMEVDAARLERALLNLLSNAQQRGRSGGVLRLRVARESDEVVVAVADDGPGIPIADLERVFERFYRRPTQPPGETGGGLGLAITRAFVELHGGRVWAESAAGMSATLWIALPLTAPREDEPALANEGESRAEPGKGEHG